MRALPPRAKIADVTIRVEDSISLDLRPGDPISGTLRDRRGAIHQFRGWLELCAAIDQAWQTSKDEGQLEDLDETARR
jgi:hypothetical protein